jgi:hypothetical protein
MANSQKAFYITLAGSPAPAPLPKPFVGMAVAGTFNKWSTSADPAVEEGDYYVLKGIKAAMADSNDAGDKGFKFVYSNEDESQEWYGAASASVSASKWYNVNSDGGAANVYVSGDAAADYDVYISKDRKVFCVVPAGAELPSQDEVGTPGDDVVMTDKKLYLDPWQWSSDNAVLSAYFFGGGEPVWVSMTQDGNLYSCNIPAGYSSVIFVRLDPTGTLNDWPCWNQTIDLDLNPDLNCYTITAWDNGEGKSVGSWSAYTPGESGGQQPDPTPGQGGGSTQNKLYLDPWQWTSDGATISAYFFGGGNPVWVSMTNEGGLYSCTIPDGYTSVIFVRLNPAGIQNDWPSKWNQTIDLTLTSGLNCYTITTWDNGEGKSVGTWSTK